MFHWAERNIYPLSRAELFPFEPVPNGWIKGVIYFNQPFGRHAPSQWG